MNQAAHSFAILFWPNNQRVIGDKTPIYLRLTVNAKRVEIATHQSVLLQNWDQKAQGIKGNSPAAQLINRLLNIMKADIHNQYGLLFAFGKMITAETIKNAYLGIGEKQRTLKEEAGPTCISSTFCSLLPMRLFLLAFSTWYFNFFLSSYN